MNPKETLYYAEKASLEIRVGLYDNAIATAKESLSVDANDSDGYLFLGVPVPEGQQERGNTKPAESQGNGQSAGR